MGVTTRNPAASCHGKVKFSSYEAAKRNGMGSNRLLESALHVYHCRTCQHFHIGTTAKKPGCRQSNRDPDDRFAYENDYDRRKR